MKKSAISLMTGVLILVTLCLFSFSAYAAETVSVSIPVEVEGGGTAIIISEVNCPLPESSSIEVPNGMTENINIEFFEPGSYSYTVQAVSNDDLYFEPRYYIAEITVKYDAVGKLNAMTVLTKADSAYKPDMCYFVRAEQPVDPTLPTPTEAVTPTQPSKNPPTSRPKTGDDNQLDIYLLICIAASGGLFALSIFYSVSTHRLVGKR